MTVIHRSKPQPLHVDGAFEFARLRLEVRTEQRAADAMTKIRAMAEKARRSIGQKIRYARAACD